MSDFVIMLAVSAAIATVICLAWPVLRWVVFGPGMLIGLAGEAIGSIFDELAPEKPVDMLSHGEQIGPMYTAELQAGYDNLAQQHLIGAYRESYPDGYYPALPSEFPVECGDGYARMLPPTE